MHFDNAFKTKAGKIGMQFVDKKSYITVYRDKKDNITVSDAATAEQKEQATAAYLKREKFFLPRKEPACPSHARMGCC